MTVFLHEAFCDHEQVVFVSDEAAGLKAIIAIHDTTLGPALGGCRMYPYADEEAALRDALRLSRGMTYKAAACGLDLGGGKAVIIGDPLSQKTPSLLEAMGRAVERLAGRYITAEDVGTTVADAAEIRKATRHVVGLPVALGGTGDPSPTTALGVFHGLAAAVRHRWGADSLAGQHVAVQGLGNVGWHLCQLLHEAGASLTVSDVQASRVAKAVATFAARAVAPESIYAAEVDIFAPCAMGAVLNDDTVTRLRCAIVAGAANNQLAHEEHGEVLRSRSILYAPDFVINAGGMIRVASERDGYDQDLVDRGVAGIGHTLLAILQSAEAEDVPTQAAALRLAQTRLAQARAARALRAA
ncbi:Glu/Leu/Phe/Val dehydrogenase [Phreatobacter aquaticus]|uniref:Glu/Leu/Phe/Val dehydrogenase n=1 Tax=Phreatobacter aquaticus TaxID=2570229 RepID=A0A4D7QJA7_9HYPH|nr:Glu/Leu/Phe/Val dehydrogenase dimerization domain-containing protein [Phreatobacter aquaticus]QCK85377.1 Glu/Leu/Phe/Val dehydrogenase [Phreatobacter aquaticus]